MPGWLRRPVVSSVAVLEEAARVRRGRAAAGASAAAWRLRESLTPRRLAFAAALLLAFAVPFSASALSGAAG